jgi:hypothetical protein
MDGLDGADGTVLVGALVERHFCRYRTKGGGGGFGVGGTGRWVRCFVVFCEGAKGREGTVVRWVDVLACWRAVVGCCRDGAVL